MLSAVFSVDARGPCTVCGLPIAPDRVAQVRNCDTCDALLCCAECQGLHEETCEEGSDGSGRDASGVPEDPGLCLEVQAGLDGSIVGGGFSTSPTSAAAAAAASGKVWVARKGVRMGEGEGDD